MCLRFSLHSSDVMSGFEMMILVCSLCERLWLSCFWEDLSMHYDHVKSVFVFESKLNSMKFEMSVHWKDLRFII